MVLEVRHGLSMSQVEFDRFRTVVAERVYTDVLREHYMECHGIPGAIRIECFGSDCDFEWGCYGGEGMGHQYSLRPRNQGQVMGLFDPQKDLKRRHPIQVELLHDFLHDRSTLLL